QSRQHIEVLNVRMDEAGNPVSAVLYIPAGRENVISRQMKDYANPRKNKQGDLPSHYKKYDRTLDVVPAGLRQLWIDQTPFPTIDEAARWEAWLRAGSFEKFAQVANSLDGASVSAHS